MSNWRRVSYRHYESIAEFLRKHECCCVAAASRFLHGTSQENRGWIMPGENGGIDAFLLAKQNSLFPVFDGKKEIPPPRFLKLFLAMNFPHALQGLRDEVCIMEKILEGQGYTLKEGIDYDLMMLKETAGTENPPRQPAGLIMRNPEPEDLDAIYELQAAYEQEEVLPKGRPFNPSACRYSTEIMLKREDVMIAELDGRLAGKINTNARSFSYCQIGGVYVLPRYRNMGIAAAMSATFSQKLLNKGWSLSLYVKKRNPFARRAYERVGFKTIGDYRITYY